MVQLNAPYAATPALTAFLRSRGIDARQEDLSIRLALRLLSRGGIEEAVERLHRAPRPAPASRAFLRAARRYADAVGPAVSYLQGREPALASRLASGAFLPEGPRFEPLRRRPVLRRIFRSLPVADRARHLASLFVDDIADAVRGGVDAGFGLSRYAEHLVPADGSFARLARALESRRGLVERWIDELAAEAAARHRPDLLAVTVPFPGTVYAAFRVAAAARRARPGLRSALGGAVVNTEWRRGPDPAVFDHFDFVALDDGEEPLRRIAARAARPGAPVRLLRAFRRRGARVTFEDDPSAGPLRHRDRPAPTCDGLPARDYLGLLEMLNPMHRLWSDRFWNRLLLAHGCYWHRCSFCDIGLDHIARYDPAPAARIVEWIESLRAETGADAFHFTDEAAPPALLRALADRLAARRVRIAWWTNVRLESVFTPDLARRLARAGCVAVTGGLEAPVDRLLRALDKGITLREAARAVHAFARAGVLVHLYLMYDVPTQTIQETVDGLECVRQLFAAGWVQSAYWHRFALSPHSPMFEAADDAAAGLSKPWTRALRAGGAAGPPTPDAVRDALGEGLRKAAYNFMHGAGWDADVRTWFNVPAPPPTLSPRAVREWTRG